MRKKAGPIAGDRGADAIEQPSSSQALPAPAAAETNRGAAPRRAPPVRLRTLAYIRWAAVAGQAVTVLGVHYGLGLSLPLMPALAVIALSALLNLVTSLGQPARVRLSDRSAAIFLAYDILQLAALLFLTGGLSNPFALLMLAPVTVSATMLSRRITILLCALAISVVTALMLVHLPLPWGPEGFAFPERFLFGVWSALVVGILFFAAYAGRVAGESRAMSQALAAAEQALAREQRFAAIGALAAAAAHELGSPLATIAIAAREIARDLPAGSPLVDDIRLVLAQADRCRAILTELAERPPRDGETGFMPVPLSVIIGRVCAAQSRAGIAVERLSAGLPGIGEPQVRESPQLLHGLANVIDNALQFARGRVLVRLDWDQDMILLGVEDDGPGFPPAVLSRLGEPFLSTRAGEGGHMGLGVFIAETLLGQTGARLSYRNRRQGGAEVEVHWPRARLAVEPRPGEGAAEEMQS